MGQTATQHVKNVIPFWLKSDLQKLHVEIKKDFSLVKKEFFLAKDIALIDYHSLRDTIARLNTILKSCCNNGIEKVLFGLRTMPDEPVYWKAVVKILCFKVNIREKTVTVTRYMNLHQFWRLRADILRELHYKELLDANNDGGFEVIQHSHASVEDLETEDDNVTEPLNAPTQLTVSTILERVNQVGNCIEADECLICMDNKVEVSLPCAHSYCAECINQWNIESPTCPTCREQIRTTDEFWEIADMPNIDQMNKHLVELATGT